MPSTTVDIQTKTSICKTEIFTPAGNGPWPAVIVCFDAFGVRPALSEIAARISSWGYVVAVPDFFHDAGSPFDLLPPGSKHDTHTLMGIFGDPDLRAKFMGNFMGPALSYEHIENDVAPLLDYFSKRSDVKGGIGTTGYCMGGFMSLTAAGTYPDRIVAAASYHGGRLATDAPDSPHLLAPKIRARVYVAGAIEDSSFPDEMKARLEAALTAADVDHTIETYPAKHGWVFRDTPVYDAAASERHMQTLVALLDGKLKA